MINLRSTQLSSINIQINPDQDIVGVIHKETLLKELEKYKTNDKGLIEFKCDRRRHPSKNGKPYTHMPPTIISRSHLDYAPIIPPALEEE